MNNTVMVICDPYLHPRHQPVIGVWDTMTEALKGAKAELKDWGFTDDAFDKFQNDGRITLHRLD